MPKTDPWDDVTQCWRELSDARKRLVVRLVREVRAHKDEPQVCPACTAPFYPTKSPQQFCSNACRRWAVLDRRRRSASQYGVCRMCGSAFALVTWNGHRVLARHRPRCPLTPTNAHDCGGSLQPPAE